MADYKVLRRSRYDRLILGVCSGLADFFGLPATNVRLAYVLATVLTGGLPGLVIYLILALLMPLEDYPPSA